MEPSANPAVLDQGMLEEATGGDAELMLELAELYTEDAALQLDQLETAVTASDLDAIGRIAHGLKGSSLSIGASECAEIFKRLEEKGRNGDGEALTVELDAARAAFGRVREALGRLAA